MTLIKSVALALVAALALQSQISFTWRDGISSLPSPRRFWDDLTLGIARYVDATSPGPAMENTTSDLAPLIDVYRTLVEEKVRTFEVEPHQFWKTVNDQKFRTLRAAYAQPAFEDSGRSRLLSLCFRAMGGVAPYLLLWLGALCFVPVLGWMFFELVRAGLGAAALALGALVVLSPFFVESLTLPHSAIAFYLGGVVAVGAFAVATFIPAQGRRPGWGSLAPRAMLLSFILVVAIWCRSSSVLIVPAAFLVASFGFSKGGLGRGRAIALAAALILLPALLLRPPQTHNVWVSLWEGLGDFGTDRGYSWYDADANRFLTRRGIPGFADPKDVNATQEAAFREAFLAEVRTSPAWFARVLVQRFFATVALTKLSPWGPRDGESRSVPLFHYKFTTPIDWFGWKEQLYEVPISTLFIPTLTFLVWGVFDRGRIAGAVAVLATVGLATLPVPILISTASGLETEAFGLVYFLGAAFLVQRIADSLVPRLSHA
jgi:hypothetical protein